MSRKITTIIIHHSEGQKDTFETIKNWQTTKDSPNTPEKEGMGWSHISYHYVIEQSGKIFLGADETSVAGGTKSSSTNALEVCLCGNFEIQTPTPKALSRLHVLLTNWCKTYKLVPNDKTIVGHKEIQPKKGDRANTCPGKNLLAKLPVIRTEVHSSVFGKGKGSVGGTARL